MNLEKFINEEKMILPNYNNLNIVDLAKTLYIRYGIKIEENDNIKKIQKMIPDSNHMVFVLIDGMGSNLINELDNNSILKINKLEDLITVSPSSTGCVLTTLATAMYPSEHGIIGWYSYDKKHNINYYPLLFTERESNIPLDKFNIKVEDIFKKKSKFNDLNVHTTVLFPESIFDSVYSNYIANKKIRKPYKTIEDAINQIIELTASNQRTFTYLYISDIDDLEHDYGYNSAEVKDKIKEIEFQLSRLMKKNIVTVITADHGQTNVSKDIIMDFDNYNKYFYAYPGIDFGMATYYIKKGMDLEFIEQFNLDYKDKMELFKTSEFIDNKVFGLSENNKNILNNLGEYISLCKNDYQFINSKNIDDYYGKTKGNHSGLTKDEMIIPLIVLDGNK